MTDLQINLPAAGNQTDPPRRSTVYRDILILCTACVALLAPFLDKPAHIDDPLFIWTARQISVHPLDFYGYKLNWSGHLEPMSSATMNPPLMCYFLAAAAKVVGWNEVALHAALLPFTLLSTVGLYCLAGLFCRSPLPAALLMLLCPAFLVSSSTLMCEVPFLCFWLWATYFWIRGSIGSRWWLVSAGVTVALAILTKYAAVCLIPLFVGHAVIHSASWRTRIMQGLSLSIPVGAIAAYNDYTLFHYGHGMFVNAIGFSSSFARENDASTCAKLLDGILFVGGGALAASILAFTAAKWAIRLLIIAMVPLLSWSAMKLFHLPAGWNSALPYYAQAGLLAAAGMMLVVLCAADFRRSIATRFRDSLFLLMWIGGVFVFAAQLNWAINARSILPLVPPVCILTQRAMEQHGLARGRSYILAFSIAALITVLVMISDDQSAAGNRWAAEQLMKGRSSEKVWFTGHWGFQYYMQQHGAFPLEEQAPACKPNDLVIVPLNNYGNLPHGLQLKAIDSLLAEGSSFLTLVNGPMGADFYYSPGDRLPFVFGSIPPDGFVVFRVISNKGR